MSRATCRRSTQDRHLHHSGGSARRMVPRRSRSDQLFGRYSRKYLDTQTSQLKCRSLTSLLLPCFQLVGKCTGLLISLSHSMHVLPSWTVAHVVNALVVSSIRYCVAIYGSCNITQLNRIQKLLNFCARVISGRSKFQHISDVLQQLRLLPAVQLVKNHRLCLVKTALETSLPSDITEMFSHVSTPYQTRQTGLLQNHRARTCSGTRILAHCNSVFNQLPPDLRCLSGNAFKRNLKKLLLIEAWPDD